MFSKQLIDAMNEQMKNEFLSAYLYLAMAGYFEAEDLPGIASWMRVQALEEAAYTDKPAGSNDKTFWMATGALICSVAALLIAIGK